MGPSCALNRAIPARGLGVAQDNTTDSDRRPNGM